MAGAQMRHLRNALWFFAGVLLATWAVFSHAETVDAHVSYTPVTTKYISSVSGVSGSCSWSVPEACQSGAAAWNAANPSSNYHKTFVSATGTMCYFSEARSGNTLSYGAVTCGTDCPPGSTLTNGQCATYTCDPGWTLSGTQCIHDPCPSGQIWSSSFGKCVPVCDSEQYRNDAGECYCQKGRASASWKSYREGSGSAPDYVCIGGCQVDINFAVSMGGRWGGHIGRSNGSTCSTQDAAPGDQHKKDADSGRNITPQGCLMSGQGYVTSSTGVTTCVPPGDSPEPLDIKRRQSSTTTGPDGGVAKKDVKVVENCVGSNCTVTETTMTTSPTGETSTSTSTGDKDGYCANNPNASICKKCAPGSKELSCMEVGDVEDAGTVDTKAIGPSSVAPVAVSSNEQCPTGAQLPKGLGYYNWDPMCQMASALKPIVLAFAWLAAGLIVLTGKAD